VSISDMALGRIYTVISTGDLEVAERHLRTAMSFQPDNTECALHTQVAWGCSNSVTDHRMLLAVRLIAINSSRAPSLSRR
jgi:hypothetical protein